MLSTFCRSRESVSRSSRSIYRSSRDRFIDYWPLVDYCVLSVSGCLVGQLVNHESHARCTISVRLTRNYNQEKKKNRAVIKGNIRNAPF